MQKTSDKREKLLSIDITVDAAESKTTAVELASVTQTRSAQLAAVLTNAAESVSASNFAVVREDNVVIPVKSAVLDSTNKTKVTIETFVDMKDAKLYTVTYTAPTEDKTVSSVQFTATDGVIADLALASSTVTAGQESAVKIQTLDATGILLNEYGLSATASANITANITPAAGGYTNKDNLYLPNVGDTATANVVYHTYKYVNGVEEGAITRDFVITAVPDSAVMSNFNYTITNADKTPAWTSASYKQNTQVVIGDEDDAQVYAHFQFKDSNGVDKTAYYSVSSSDSSVLLVGEKAFANGGYFAAVQGVKEGTAYIVVKDANGVVVTTLPVTVVAKRTAQTLELNYYSFTLSRTIDESKNIDLTVKDQYGVSMSAAKIKSSAIEALVVPASVTKAVVENLAGEYVEKTATGYKFKSKEDVSAIGTYTYRITVTMNDGKQVSSIVIVNIQEAKLGNESYALEFTNLDANGAVDLVAATMNDHKTVGFKVYRMKGGVKEAEVTNDGDYDIEYTVKYQDGSVVYTTEKSQMPLSIVTEGAIKGGSEKVEAIKKLLPAGTYTVTAKTTYTEGNAGSPTVLSISKVFTITDTQLLPTLEVKNTNADGRVLNAVFRDDTSVKFSYDGSELIIGDKATARGGIVDFNVKDISNPNQDGRITAFVNSVEIWFTTEDGAKVYATVPVNQVFTNLSSTD